MAKKKVRQVARLASEFPLQEALKLAWADAEAAARQLGFDTRGDWFREVLSESYGCNPEGLEDAFNDDRNNTLFMRHLRGPVMARAQALSSLAYLTELLRHLSDPLYRPVCETEHWIKLRKALASDPPGIPCNLVAKQVIDRAA